MTLEAFFPQNGLDIFVEIEGMGPGRQFKKSRGDREHWEEKIWGGSHYKCLFQLRA